MNCEYQKTDQVMDYCINPNDCMYQDNSLVMQEITKIGVGDYKFQEFSRCIIPETNTIFPTIDSLIE
jgi:hypothetical protein